MGEKICVDFNPVCNVMTAARGRQEAREDNRQPEEDNYSARRED